MVYMRATYTEEEKPFTLTLTPSTRENVQNAIQKKTRDPSRKLLIMLL